ncbi:PREDICTED: putative nuclease HARBI1 [Vollenhovia emeryi]|nr:PREDICTED: putative nuclease HARBI1 [Vollenhovia emeryi]
MIRLYNSGDRSTWLLGDSGYGLEPWLMTPITNAPEGSAEAQYTQCHSSTRNCIERTFGVLKNTWRCLLKHRVLHYKPIVVSNIVITCAVLHNIRLHYKLMNRDFDIDEEGEAEAIRRAMLPENLEACNRVRLQAQEIIDIHDMHLNPGNILIEARRTQRRILRNQFGLREDDR